jgi:NADH dehydrogenase
VVVVHIVILGAGFGGTCTAKYLVKKLKKDVQITLIDRNTYHFFTPLVHEVATGAIDANHIKRPLRPLFRDTNVQIIRGNIQKIDHQKKEVILCANCLSCTDREDCTVKINLEVEGLGHCRKRAVTYDYLVVAMGSAPNFFGIEGAQENSFVLNNITSAEAIKEHIVSCFEIAEHVDDVEAKKSLLTFVIVGAGATGVEFSIELHDLCIESLTQDFEYIDFETHGRIILAEMMDRILPMMDEPLIQYAKELLAKRNIELRTGASITQVGKKEVQINNEETIPSHTVIWSAGVKANDVVAGMDAPHDRIGRLKVAPSLQLEEYADVFALGDNTCYLNEKTQKPLPQTAAVAVQQAKCVADNLALLIKGKPPQPFNYIEFGTTISLGKNQGIANLLGHVRFRGFGAWFSWKTVYLRHLLIIESPWQALWEWFIDLVYNREISRYKVH